MVIASKKNATNKKGELKKGFEMKTASTGRIMYFSIMKPKAKEPKAKEPKAKKMKAEKAPDMSA